MKRCRPRPGDSSVAAARAADILLKLGLGNRQTRGYALLERRFSRATSFCGCSDFKSNVDVHGVEGRRGVRR